MISELKLGMRLIKYSFNLKQNVALIIIFTICGIVWFFVDMWLFGPLYLAIVGLYFHQMLNSLQFSDMVLSSPKQKELQLTVTSLVSILWSLIYYALTVVVTTLNNKLPYQEGYSFKAVVLFGGVSMFMMIYEVLWPKMGTVTVLLSIALIFGSTFLAFFSETPIWEEISPKAAVGIGLAEIFLGAVLQYVSARLTYRMPVKYNPMFRAMEKYK